MNRIWVVVTVIGASVGVGCGQGRLIFNVDAFSWIKGDRRDTVPYFALPGFTDSASTVQKISLPGGLGSSLVDTVKVSGTADLQNQSGGPGTMTFQVYLAGDSAGTYTASRDSMLTPAISATVSGSSTTPLVINANNLSPRGDSLFTKSAIWVRITARVSNPSGVLIQGKAVLTKLDLRVVIQDKFF